MVDMTNSEFVAHEPCNNCGSSDANSVYTDGHKFCFVCQTYTPAEGAIHTHKMSKNVHLKGSAERLQKRNISEKIGKSSLIYDAYSVFQVNLLKKRVLTYVDCE